MAGETFTPSAAATSFIGMARSDFSVSGASTA